jgi:hypothetical protein
MKRWTGIMLFAMAAIVATGVNVQAAEIVAQPKALLQPSPPAVPVPGKQFTFYIPVNISNLHPTVKKVVIACELVGARRNSSQLEALYSEGGASDKQIEIPLIEGKYVGTVTLAYNISPFARAAGNPRTDVNEYDKFSYSCSLVGFMKDGDIGVYYIPQLLTQGTIVQWNSYRTGTLQVSGSFP